MGISDLRSRRADSGARRDDIESGTAVLGRRALVAAALAALAPWSGSRLAQAATQASPALPAAFADIDALRTVAQAYRRAHGDDPAVPRLYRAYCRCDAATRDVELGRWLERSSADDLAAGRVVVLSGWVLTPSEARLCAMLSLLGAPR
jgi:hypothetical protein